MKFLEKFGEIYDRSPRRKTNWHKLPYSLAYERRPDKSSNSLLLSLSDLSNDVRNMSSYDMMTSYNMSKVSRWHFCRLNIKSILWKQKTEINEFLCSSMKFSEKNPRIFSEKDGCTPRPGHCTSIKPFRVSSVRSDPSILNSDMTFATEFPRVFASQTLERATAREALYCWCTPGSPNFISSNKGERSMTCQMTSSLRRNMVYREDSAENSEKKDMIFWWFLESFGRVGMKIENSVKNTDSELSDVKMTFLIGLYSFNHHLSGDNFIKTITKHKIFRNLKKQIKWQI